MPRRGRRAKVRSEVRIATVTHRDAWPRRRLAWALLALVLAVVAGTGLAVGVDRAFFSGAARWSWPPRACVWQGTQARCGSFDVPENRARPNGPTIGLRVVVLPALLQPARPDAVAYLAGGPGDAATEQAADLAQGLPLLNTYNDILLVDQRGTGGSTRHGADVTQYGTRMAMDDVEAVRAALGYRQLDVVGGSYGATAAQVYLRLHPATTRVLVLIGATALDVPFFGRYAVNAQRALDQLARRCVAERDCRAAFPEWERQFGELVRAWNDRPVHGMSGDDLAAVVHAMLLDLNRAVAIPLVVSRAAAGDFRPLDHAGHGDAVTGSLGLMASIWCDEPWAGLGASGPWGTEFDSYTTAKIARFRQLCAGVPPRAEPRSLWTLPRSSSVPVLALVGGADPQDPVANIAEVRQHFPDSRILVFPRIGHRFPFGDCVDQLLSEFVDTGTTGGLDASRCVSGVGAPAFKLAG
jgi:pimeloyl-ACP methyl ester carboxylesterase